MLNLGSIIADHHCGALRLTYIEYFGAEQDEEGFDDGEDADSGLPQDPRMTVTVLCMGADLDAARLAVDHLHTAPRSKSLCCSALAILTARAACFMPVGPVVLLALRRGQVSKSSKTSGDGMPC